MDRRELVKGLVALALAVGVSATALIVADIAKTYNDLPHVVLRRTQTLSGKLEKNGKIKRAFRNGYVYKINGIELYLAKDHFNNWGNSAGYQTKDGRFVRIFPDTRIKIWEGFEVIDQNANRELYFKEQKRAYELCKGLRNYLKTLL
ncbi:MAG: hypothetical protein Q8N88_02090 [Nanoarchaeota archaeon]|nr:hypothetical protein [Nanoarchaeota archaeon]